MRISDWSSDVCSSDLSSADRCSFGPAAMTSFVGQEAQMKAFLAASASARMHHGWILAGIRGLGKARFARAAATHLLAEAARPPLGGEGFFFPSGPCYRTLIVAGTHPPHLCLTPQDRQTTRHPAPKPQPT